MWCSHWCVTVFVLFTPVWTEDTNFADIQCGVPPRARAKERALSWRRGRIVGGETASKGEFPWIVSLTRSGGHFCGGTIVNKNWVLTAAHCLCSGTDILGLTSIRVSVGQHDLRQSAFEIPVSALRMHPQFVCGRYDNDIALLELKDEVPWSAAAAPACFPAVTQKRMEEEDLEQEINNGSRTDAVVAGWGWTDESSAKGVRSNVLRKVRLEVVDNPTCSTWYHSRGKRINLRHSQMCAGFENGGKDACWADSGGPLMVGTGAATVVGVVSTGVGCARPHLPGVYTRVSQFLPWISSSIASSS